MTLKKIYTGFYASSFCGNKICCDDANFNKGEVIIKGKGKKLRAYRSVLLRSLSDRPHIMIWGNGSNCHKFDKKYKYFYVWERFDGFVRTVYIDDAEKYTNTFTT